jgi:hypothetical protein
MSVMDTARTPNAVLAGGPLHQLPEEARLCFVTDTDDQFKLSLGNRYEHYTRSPETIQHALGVLRVYRWTRSTFVAE